MRSRKLHEAVRSLLAVTAAAGLGTAVAQDAAQPAEPSADMDAPIEEVIVEGRQQSSAEQILEERIKLDVVADIVGAEQIGRVGDSTVSLALRRLPAVTVVADQFIYVRGLGERYSSTTLNGAYVPSPDLTRNVIPLDLFPAEIVDSLTVQKGYSPELPAAFGGGSVNVRTRAIPEEPLLSMQVGTGWNSDSGDDGWSYRGGGDDRLGTDDGTRALPGEVSRAIDQYTGNLSPAGIFESLRKQGGIATYAEAEQLNRQLATSLYRDLDLQSKSLDPDLSIEAAAGNSWTLDDAADWKIGVMAVGDYKNQWRNRERTNRSVADPENVSSETLRTTNTVNVTGSLSAGVAYAGEHSVQALGLLLRNTDDEASLTLGNNSNFQQASGDQYRNYRVRFEERELEVFQLRGGHRLGDATMDALGGASALERLRDLELDWYYSHSTATTDLPTEVTFSARDRVDPVDGALIETSIRPSTTAADYRYTDLQDEVNSYGWSFAFPMEFGESTVKLQGGYDYYEKGRTYLQTQLGLGTTSAAALPALQGTPGEVFTDEKILDPANGFVLSLGGIGTESYLAAETIDAGWGKVDWTWKDQWRVSAGARWEDFAQLSVPIDQYEYDTNVGIVSMTPEELERAATAENDWYPALAVTYMRDDFWAERFQLRFGWSLTTARPDLRELADATYIDPITEARVRGNPDLVKSDLANYDLRAEWFFASGDNVTASLFYKQIDQPIETIQAPGTDDNVALTFINAETADLYGVELEFLHGLGWISPESNWASAFFLAGNLTLSDSKLEIGSAAPNLTSDERRLSQHAPWVVNLQLGFDAPNGRHGATLAYNASGERLFFAGRGGEPDAYEQPFHSLDLTYSYYPTDALSFKVRLQNVLDESTTIEQGGVDVIEQTVGSTVKLDVTYSF
jgi:TonB-dependent receptor